MRARLTALSLALSATVLSSHTARADELEPPAAPPAAPGDPAATQPAPPDDIASRLDAADVAALIERVAAGSVRSARRSIVVGPALDLFGGGDLSHRTTFGGLAVGLAVYTYESASPLDLRAQVTAAIKAQLKERLAAMAAAGTPPPGDLDDLVEAIARDVVRRIVTLESPVGPPRFAFLFELGGAPLGSADFGGLVRVVVAKGVGRALVGLSIAGEGGFSDAWFVPGLEISLPTIPSGGNRTPVLAGYLRGDVALGSGATSALVTVGARLTLDLL